MDHTPFYPGIYPNNLISGKYYLIEQDSRFPLQPTGEWKPLLEAARNSPNSIYILSGYGVQYIGKDKNGTRPQSHRRDFLKIVHSNSYMQNAVNEHGISGFFYQELVKLPENCVQHINIIENAYIKHFDTYRNGYNLQEFASMGNLGKKMSKEQKLKISQANTGKKKTPEHIAKLPQNQKGKIISAEARKKISENNPNKTKYELLSPTGELFFGENVREFCKINNLSCSGIFSVIKKRQRTHKGWTLPLDQIPQEIKVQNAGKKYNLLSPDGEIFKGENLSNFAREKGLNISNLCALTNRSKKSYRGWTIPPESLDETIPPIRKKKFRLLSPNGIIIEGEGIKEFCRKNALSESCLGRIISGKQNSHKGWTLPKENLDENQT